MAFNTNRNNIKQVFRLIPFMMMILLRRFTTAYALQRFSTMQIFDLNSGSYCLSSDVNQGVFKHIKPLHGRFLSNVCIIPNLYFLVNKKGL